MCGIVGIAGDLAYKDKDVFNEMLFFCQLRGEDSTGIFQVPTSGNETSIIKALGTPDNLFATTKYDRLSFFQSRALIGHCRKATIGGVKLANAHPFRYGDLTGVHNGTLRNWQYLPGDAEAIDSQTLYENFSRVGVKPTIEAVDGAYALIWYDASDDTLNVLRNKERPLFYAFSEDFSKILWASEAWMITIAADRNGMKLADLTPKESYTTRALLVDTDMHWKLKLGRSSKETIKFLGEADGHEQKLEGGVNKAKYEAPFRPSYAYSNGYPFNANHTSTPSSTPRLAADKLDDKLPDDVETKVLDKQPAQATPGTTPTPAASANTSSSSTSTSETTSTRASTAILPRRPTLTLVQTNRSDGCEHSGPGGTLIGNNNVLLTEHEFTELVNSDCCWCQKPNTFHELREGGKLGAWIDDTEYLCSDCVRDDLAVACN